MTVTCQGCRRRTTFTALQAVLKFGDDATESAVVRRLRCEGCGKRGRTDSGWFRASFGFPVSAWLTPDQLADVEDAAKFDEQQRSQFAEDHPAATPRRKRR